MPILDKMTASSLFFVKLRKFFINGVGKNKNIRIFALEKFKLVLTYPSMTWNVRFKRLNIRNLQPNNIYIKL